ncbi:MAG: tetratricopeptide repeat protein [Myxococcota bacterium]
MIAASLAVWVTVAVADPPPNDPDLANPDTDELNEDRVLGKEPPPLSREPRSAALTTELPTVNADESLPYPKETYLGAEMLKLDPMFVYGVQHGLELIYLRKYTDARTYFGELETTFPGTATRSVADTLVWQALMLENFDYRYDKQYWTASKQARKDLDAAIAAPGNESWDHLASAAIVGIESIHTMRQGSYLSALQLAFQAMEHIERCRQAAPTFIDLKLADGLYNYWRSVVTMNSKVLPDFGDHRVEGIEQMTTVQDGGVFMGPMASLALAFSWMEEGDLKRASSACTRNRTKYPDNIINNLTCGTIYTYDHRYDDALRVLDQILVTDASNMRVHYWKGFALLKKGQLAGAKAELTMYLASAYLEPYQKSYAYFRLGQVYAREQDFPKAIENYQAAVKIDGNKAAKGAIDKLEEKKKEGKATF